MDFRQFIYANIVLFLLVVAATFSYSLSLNEDELPGSISTTTVVLSNIVSGVNDNVATREKASPKDRIPEKDIYVYNNEVVIKIKNPEWARFTDTNSMDPVIDFGANAIEIIPQSPDEIQVGDIVSYQTKFSSDTFIHRVIEIGNDGNGWYARFKGDNNPGPDPEKVRFEQIRRIVVAIIY